MMRELVGSFLQEPQRQMTSMWLDQVPSPTAPSERSCQLASSLGLNGPKGSYISLLGFLFLLLCWELAALRVPHVWGLGHCARMCCTCSKKIF